MSATNQPYTHYHSHALHYARRVTCYGQPDIITTRMKNVQANAQASRIVHVLRSALFRLIKSYAFLFLLPRSLTACLPAATSTIRLAGFVALALHDSIYLFIYLFIIQPPNKKKVKRDAHGAMAAPVARIQGRADQELDVHLATA